MKKSYFIISSFLLCIGLIIYGYPYKQLSKQSGNSTIQLENSFNKNKLAAIVVIGGGSAGLSAAIYGARSNLHTINIVGNQPGGQLSGTTHVDNFPGAFHQLGPDIMLNIKNQAQACGAQFLYETVNRVDFSQWPYRIETQEGTILYALTCVIATGANPRLLNIPGEKEYWGKGVTTCAICDAPFHKGKEVIIVGGGDSACEEALQLASFAEKVTICVRKDRMRASAAMQQKIKNVSNITILYNTEVKKIRGDGQTVTEAELFNTITNSINPMKVSGVFLAIGHEPNTQLFSSKLMTDQNHYLILQGRTQATSLPGVFAAGDVCDPIYKQAVVAAGEGAKAALEAHKFLENLGFNEKIAQKLQPHYFIPEQINKHNQELYRISSADEFNQLLNSNEPVIIDFYTDYCPSCLQMLPFIEQAASEYGNKLKVVKCDASGLKEVAKQCNVSGVPALVAFKNGKEIKRSQEAMNKQQVNEFFATIV